MIQHRLGIAAARNATLAATVPVSTSHGAQPWKQVGEFEDASIRVEQNATDGDTEIANGTAFYGAAELAHQMPGATIILAPAADQQVPAGSLTIRWTAVADAAQYIVEIENESADPEQRSPPPNSQRTSRCGTEFASANGDSSGWERLAGRSRKET